jgi:hypothetical protein
VLLILVAGAALATWGLSRGEGAARFLGVDPPDRPVELRLAPGLPATKAIAIAPDTNLDTRVAAVEARLRNVESVTQQAAGSVGRADALLVAFATRRAVDRGLALGYLEPLLSQKFGASHPRAVATIVTAAREPVTLDKLTSDYRALEPELRRGPPDEGYLTALRRELSSLVTIHRSTAPSPMVEARYDRAIDSLQQGGVDAALAETMRLPGAARAAEWVVLARRYVATHRALDEIESSALLAGGS